MTDWKRWDADLGKPRKRRPWTRWEVIVIAILALIIVLVSAWPVK